MGKTKPDSPKPDEEKNAVHLPETSATTIHEFPEKVTAETNVTGAKVEILPDVVTPKEYDPTAIDSDMGHIYPAFAQLVTAALSQANYQAQDKHFPDFGKFVLYEGFRFPARQEALYAQGAPVEGQPSGAGVTYQYGPVGMHTRCLAADIAWLDTEGKPHLDGPEALWQVWGAAVKAHQMTWGGNFVGLADNPHCQPNEERLASWIVPARSFGHSMGLPVL